MDTPNLQFEKDYSSPLISRWWILVLAFVLIYGFAVLITVTYKAYDGRPPIPETVTDSEGNLLFTGNDIREGQSVFLRYGLHDNGSVWGHGAYLGPDFSADYLHQVAMATRELNPGKSTEQINKIAKTNRYDSATGRLVLDNAQTSVFAEAPDYWKEYLSDPSNNGGLQRNLITDRAELHKLSAFFCLVGMGMLGQPPRRRLLLYQQLPLRAGDRARPL